MQVHCTLIQNGVTNNIWKKTNGQKEWKEKGGSLMKEEDYEEDYEDEQEVEPWEKHQKWQKQQYKKFATIQKHRKAWRLIGKKDWKRWNKK